MEVLEQPLLHDAGGLQGYLAIFAFFAVLFLYLLFLLKLLLGLVEPADQVARIPLDNRLQIGHLLRYLPISPQTYC